MKLDCVGKNWHDSHKPTGEKMKMCYCGKREATESVVDPDFSRDLGGQLETIRVCGPCADNINSAYTEELERY